MLTPKEELSKYRLNRKFFYGRGEGGVIHAYKKEEWGIGAAQPYGNYTTHSVFALILIMVFMTPVVLFGIGLTIAAAIQLNAFFFISAFFTLLFGAGLVQSFVVCRGELKARKLRKVSGLKKPYLIVSDNQARDHFIKNPTPLIPITPEYFPDADWDVISPR